MSCSSDPGSMCASEVDASAGKRALERVHSVSYTPFDRSIGADGLPNARRRSSCTGCRIPIRGQSISGFRGGGCEVNADHSLAAPCSAKHACARRGRHLAPAAIGGSSLLDANHLRRPTRLKVSFRILHSDLQAAPVPTKSSPSQATTAVSRWCGTATRRLPLHSTR